MLSYLSSSQGSGMKAPQGWTPSRKTGEKYLAYLYHLLFWCPEFCSKSKSKGHVVFWSFPFGPQGFLGSFMHEPEGIYQANYRLDGSVHFQRFLYALCVWSGCFGTEDLLFAMVALKVNYRDL